VNSNQEEFNLKISGMRYLKVIKLNILNWYKIFKLKIILEAAEFIRRRDGKLPEGWKSVLPTYKAEDPAKATRQFSQTVINNLAKVLPEIVGGSADLNPSTLSYIDISKDYQKETPEGFWREKFPTDLLGRNIRFGVREHAMAAVCNGLHAYGGLISYGATFLNFLG
jgi:transketolase